MTNLPFIVASSKRKTIHIILAFVCSVSTFSFAQQRPYSERMAYTAMHLWPDSFRLEQDKPAKWSYDLGVLLKGVEGVWKSTANKTYFDYIQRSIDRYVQDDGNIQGYQSADFNIDFINNGKALLFLYEVTGKPKYLKAAQRLRNQLNHHPRTEEGSFWHKQIYPHQVWLDGLYMAQPFYAEYAKLFHEPTDFDDIVKQFLTIERHARDIKTGLMYHGWDESRTQQWADKTTGRSPHFWGRAMGWFGMALVDVLDYMPEDHLGRDSLIAVLNRYAEAMVKVQQANGLWYQVLDLPDRKGNYPEASASCMIAYTLAKAARLGYLPQKYTHSAEKAYKGIIANFVEEGAEGQLSLKGTVKVSGLGGKPYRDGSFDYYVSEPVVRNDPKGIGAFLLCAVEMEQIPKFKIGYGKRVLLDNYYNNEWTNNAVGQPIRFHYIWNEQDNNGYSLLGHIFKNYGATLSSLSGKPTDEQLKKADIYIIVDPDTEKETKNPHFIEGPEIETMVKWVQRGGTLVLLGNDAGNAEFEHFNQLAGCFGIHFNEDNRLLVQGHQYEQGAVHVQKGNPIFKQPYKLYLKELSSLTVLAPGKPILAKDAFTIMAITRYGKGKVFALGDPWIYNEYLDGRKLPPDFQNFSAANDWVGWLLKK